MVFDVTRKVTYKNLERWYSELQEHCKGLPTIVVANKIDVDYKVQVLLLVQNRRYCWQINLLWTTRYMGAK